MLHNRPADHAQPGVEADLAIIDPGYEYVLKKKDIHLKMNSDSFSLRAEKDDVEYVSTGNFCCPVAVKNSEADYENGLLLINIPLVDPWDNAYDVPIH